MPSRSTALAVAALALSAGGFAARDEAPPPIVLDWPVACQVGTSCEIQHYIDHDASAGAKDQTCGTRTYDKHDGIDIRLPDMAAQRAGTAVLAAADGRVLRVRDGVADVSVAVGGPETVKNTECGNAVIIGHAAGFETQYCHMARGSVMVRPGDTVKAGQPVGKVGLSGLTEFPHLHFTTRQNGRMVDPFAYGAPTDACGPGGRSLWRRTPPYQARVVLNAGFADSQQTLATIEAGDLARPDATAPVLAAYARAIGLKAGDVQALTVRAPDGSVLVQTTAEPLPRNQAQRMYLAGRRRPAQGWARGRYTATYTVSAEGKVVLSRSFALTL